MYLSALHRIVVLSDYGGRRTLSTGRDFFHGATVNDMLLLMIYLKKQSRTHLVTLCYNHHNSKCTSFPNFLLKRIYES